MRSWWTWTVLSALLLVAARPGGALPAQAAPVVQAVQFQGRANVGEDLLRAAMKLKEGRPFTPEAMEEDRKALLALGYFRSVAASQQTAGGKTDLTYRLVEWPLVQHVRILGNTVVDQRAIRGAISTRLGQVLCSRQLLADIRGIEELYQGRGYVAQVPADILDEATKTGIVRYRILEVRIDDLDLQGGSPGTRERARKALVEVPPELYRPDAVAIDQERLLEVRGVKHAVARVEATSPGKVKIRWLLNDAAPAAPPAASR